MKIGAPFVRVAAAMLCTLAAIAQQPQPYEPKTDAELQAFLQQVVRIRAVEVYPAGTTAFPVAEPVGAECEVDDPTQVRELCSGWTVAETCPLPERRGFRLHATFVDAGGRSLETVVGGAVWTRTGMWDLPNAAIAHWTRLRKDGLPVQVHSAAQLRALHNTRRSIVCFELDPDTLQAELPRFSRLTHLGVTLSDPRTASVVASLRGIRQLTVVLPQRTSAEAEWARLGRMPELRRLIVLPYGSLPPVAGLTHLTRLSFLAILDANRGELPVTLAMLQAIATLPAIEELRVTVDGGDAKQAQERAAFTAVAAMPNLRRLCLVTASVTADVALASLANAPIEQLQLAGMSLDDACIATLANLPRLRELDLRSATVRASAATELARMQRLTRLDLGLTTLDTASCDALRFCLGGCEVIANPVRVVPGRGLAVPPSWTYR